MNLTVDIGNHNFHISVWDKGNFYCEENESHDIIEAVKKLNGRLKIDHIIISDVSAKEELKINQLKSRFENKLVVFDSDEIGKYGEENRYKGKIGADRFAAYLGGQVLFPSMAMLLIDAGTAITTDVADNKGNFCGGNISLGIYSRFKALKSETGLLPFVTDFQKVTSFGYDTESAIQSGVINGVTGELIFANNRAKKEYNIEKTLLTGGDAEILKDFLTANGIEVFYDEHLVGRGLDAHLRRFYSN